MLRRSERLLLFGLFVFAVTRAASAQVAIVNVNLIRMDRERVEAGQTVVVQGDRITAVGAAADVVVPPGAAVIDGRNRYLTPGLTDAHVHLPGFAPGLTRRDFGDAPLYLAHGVTTVINLGGDSTQIEWRGRIESGDLLGPSVYTSGEFVNEPRVNTPEDVRREVVSQAREGYDLIKFHELPDTTTGLSLGAYRALNGTAREAVIPLVGHAPVNLGLDILLQERQALAHMGMLGNIYFLPLQSNIGSVGVTAAAMALLTLVVSAWGAAAAVRRMLRAAPPRRGLLSRVRIMAGAILVAGAGGLVVAAFVLPGGPLYDSIALRVLFTAIALFVAVVTLLVLALTAGLWRGTDVSMSARAQASVVSIASLALAACLTTFWVPISWRSTDRGIERLAGRLHDAGISVQTTLVVYETFSSAGRARLLQDPAIDYLRPDARDRWHRQPPAGLPGYHYDEFMKKVAGALQRAGVPLVAGTDAMGAPLIAPGSSLHRELELLTESTLTAYEAIRAATVAPAVFLGKAGEFGTIDIGKRADLLLLEDNPLQDIGNLNRLAGVMVRGKWLPSEQLQRMLTALAGKD